MTRRFALPVIACAIWFAFGLIVGWLTLSDTKTIDSRAVPTVVTVTLAPDGSAYCPADPSVPHVTPCVNQP